jgi:hypothetical protein
MKDALCLAFTHDSKFRAAPRRSRKLTFLPSFEHRLLADKTQIKFTFAYLVNFVVGVTRHAVWSIAFPDTSKVTRRVASSGIAG